MESLKPIIKPKSVLKPLCEVEFKDHTRAYTPNVKYGVYQIFKHCNLNYGNEYLVMIINDEGLLDYYPISELVEYKNLYRF